VSYLNGPATVTLQTQWIGKGKMNNELPWIDPDDAGYSPTLIGSVDNNDVGNYFNFNLNGSYDIKLARVESSQVYLSVSNLMDRDPPFSNGGIGGVNGTFYDTLGRTFRVGVRLKL
jgi:iron complex outermembrane recepter protein